MKYMDKPIRIISVLFSELELEPEIPTRLQENPGLQRLVLYNAATVRFRSQGLRTR